MCWSFLPNVRFLILLTVFELLPKTCNFTIYSIFSNSGHVGWCTASPDTILKLDTLLMIQTEFGFHWSSTFRGEDFWKSLRRTTDDGRQVMAIAHMTLWVRWAKKLLVQTKSCLSCFFLMFINSRVITVYCHKCFVLITLILTLKLPFNYIKKCSLNWDKYILSLICIVTIDFSDLL